MEIEKISEIHNELKNHAITSRLLVESLDDVTILGHNALSEKAE